MSCTKPISIRKPRSMGSSGDFTDSMVVPCGRCVGCSLDYGRMWSVRCYHESLMHSASYFLTFTIDDEHLHRNHPDLFPSLDPLHLVLFYKRLRRRGQVVRYFSAGEYGTRTLRPHYHAIVFGLNLVDLKPLSKGLSESAWLDEVWGLGKVVIGSVTPESIAYCCRYTVKKVLGRPNQWYFDRGLHPEFVRMSRRPGIGHSFFQKYGTSDIYANDKCWLPSGFEAKVPRYYDKLMDDLNPLEFREVIKPSRLERALLRASDDDTQRNLSRDIILRSRLNLSSDVF